MKLGSENLFVILIEHTWQRHGTVSAFGHYPQPKPMLYPFLIINDQIWSFLFFVYHASNNAHCATTEKDIRLCVTEIVQSTSSNGAF